MVRGALLQGLLCLCWPIIVACVNNHDADSNCNHRQYDDLEKNAG